MDDFLPGRRKRWLAAYGAVAVIFLCFVGGFYKPGFGFTRLIMFGGIYDNPKLDGLGCYIYPNSCGNDGQFYAKMALDPLLQKLPYEPTAIDSLAYRSRRILLSRTAWVLGCGNPAWIVQIYALQNAACWFLLAWVLTRWLPPGDVYNFGRWVAILFSAGVLVSVRGSMTDFPSTVLIVLAIAASEQSKEGSATAFFALAILERETSVISLLTLADPRKRKAGDLGKLALKSALAVAPFLCWLAYTRFCISSGEGKLGVNEFEWPFFSILNIGSFLLSKLYEHHFNYILHSLAFTGILTQMLFFYTRPQPGNRWWRLGIGFAVLAAFLSPICLFPVAAQRILLPMTVAFNILVPKDRRGAVWFILGNLSSLLASPMSI